MDTVDIIRIVVPIVIIGGLFIWANRNTIKYWFIYQSIDQSELESKLLMLAMFLPLQFEKYVVVTPYIYSLKMNCTVIESAALLKYAEKENCCKRLDDIDIPIEEIRYVGLDGMSKVEMYENNEQSRMETLVYTLMNGFEITGKKYFYVDKYLYQGITGVTTKQALKDFFEFEKKGWIRKIGILGLNKKFRLKLGIKEKLISGGYYWEDSEKEKVKI